MSTLKEHVDLIAERAIKGGFRLKPKRGQGYDPENFDQLSIVLNAMRSVRYDGKVKRITIAGVETGQLEVGTRYARLAVDGWRDDENRSELNKGTLEDALYYLLETAEQRNDAPREDRTYISQ